MNEGLLIVICFVASVLLSIAGSVLGETITPAGDNNIFWPILLIHQGGIYLGMTAMWFRNYSRRTMEVEDDVYEGREERLKKIAGLKCKCGGSLTRLLYTAICNDCKSKWYDGLWRTDEEWEKWINDYDIPRESIN